MISITIGYVSGIIAVGIFILQFLLPNALIVILVGYLKNEHTAANMLVGTRSWDSGKALPPDLQEPDVAGSIESNDGLVPVTVYERQIRYHWPFAIPALLALLLFILVLLAALVSLLSGKGVPVRVRHYLFHLSSGRLLGQAQYPGECDKLAPTNQGIAIVGKRPSDLQTYYVGRPGGVGGANSPFLDQHDHLASSTASDEKRKVMVTDTNDVRLTAIPASESETMLGHTKSEAPTIGYGRLKGNEQESWRSPAL